MRFCDEIVRDGGGEEQRERGKVPVEKGLMRDAGMKGRGESEVDVKVRFLFTCHALCSVFSSSSARVTPIARER